MSRNILTIMRQDGFLGTLRAIRRGVRKTFFKGSVRSEENRQLSDMTRMFACYSAYRKLQDSGGDEAMIDSLRQEIIDLETPKTRKYLRDLYVKDLIPRIYASESVRPVENTAIFMENGTTPSPSNSHISEVMEARGDYRVIHIGLNVRAIPEIEYYENACDFIRQLATARVLFLSTTNSLLSQFDLRSETQVIQLWHGAGVFKKIGYSTTDNSRFGLTQKDREEYDQYRNYSFVTIPSEEQAWIYEDAMHISRSSGILAPVGVSRTDVFYDSDYIDRARETLYSHFPQIKGKSIILYAPTFRGSVRDAKAPDALDIPAMAESLSEDYVLLIKHHGVIKSLPSIPGDLENVFAFDMNRNDIMDIDRLLAVSDICITDYSSLAFEYSILERPLIFFAYDLEDYIDQRGMYYDYDEITPGPVARTTPEIIDYILHLDERFDSGEVKRFKNKYVDMCDGHATERTLALLEN